MSLKKQSGYLIIFAVVFLAILLTLSISLLGYTTLNIKGTRQSYSNDQALYLADAGLEQAIYQLNQNSGYSGETNTPLDNGKFSTNVVSSGLGNSVTITSTGIVPNTVNGQVSKTVSASASINSTTISFNFGVQVGAGGITMNNGSQINGNIFSNGNISGSNGSTITGDATVAAGTALAADQQWTTQNTDFLFGNINARHDVAQSFVPSVTDRLNKVSVYLKKVSTPGNLTVRILTDNSGKPSKTVLDSSTILATAVTNNYGFIDASFSNAPNLIASTTYWLEISVASVNASKYYIWGLDNASGYTSGAGAYSDNWNATTPSWTGAGGDFDFKAYMGGIATSLSGSVTVQGNARATSMSGCSIVGDAYYQTTNTCSVGGTNHSGTVAPGPADMPISDAQIADWEDVASGGNTVVGPHTVSGTETMGPTVVNGDLILNNNVTLVLTGPVWVKGNISLSNNATVKIDPSLGHNGTVLLADNPNDELGSGQITISNNASVIGNGYSGSYPLLLTTNTGASAMSIGNNSSAAIFYASLGNIHLSNNAGGYQITGYSITMDNNATVTYQNGLQSSTFSNGPGGSWQFTPGTYVILH